jgi:hypothetical protein
MGPKKQNVEEGVRAIMAIRNRELDLLRASKLFDVPE